MSEICFCDGCKHLSPTEVEQESGFEMIGIKQNHRCLLHGNVLFHGDYHPKILRLANCQDWEGRGVKVKKPTPNPQAS